MDDLSVAEFTECLQAIWSRTLGHPRICVAVLDGVVDLSHSCFQGADLTQLESWVVGQTCGCQATQHGTHVASIIFGQHGGPIRGIAPRCRGVIVPVFGETEHGEILPCSQLDLSRAIAQAVEAGADIVNISGGQLEPSGQPEAPLARSIQMCADRGVLVLASAGNDGCRCLHVPAALPNVLAVGAMGRMGEPLEISNWGELYSTQGILAPGERILGASPGGGVSYGGGTSFATPIVSGVAALLMSIQLLRGEPPDAPAVRRAILESAITCDEQPADDCRRLLAGRLNVVGALSRIEKGADNMTGQNPPPQQVPRDPEEKAIGDSGEVVGNRPPSLRQHLPQVAEPVRGTGSDDLVFALGQLGYDFGSEANRDYFRHQGVSSPDNPKEMLDHLTNLALPDEAVEKLLGSAADGWEAVPKPIAQRTKMLMRNSLLVNKPDAAGLIWTLVQDLSPIYAIQPGDAFGLMAYDRLIEFLDDQENGKAQQVAIAGRQIGRVTLMNGQVVPLVRPDLRGMYNWSVDELVAAAITAIGDVAESEEETVRAEIRSFAERVYYDFRNLGITAQDRALNFAATNLFQAASAYAEAIRYTVEEATKLDTIDVERSPFCREGSDCWDVKLTFFKPAKRQEEAKRVFRFTVDVSSVIPVTVGEMRSWYVY
jgi:hypothetical protein